MIYSVWNYKSRSNMRYCGTAMFMFFCGIFVIVKFSKLSNKCSCICVFECLQVIIMFCDIMCYFVLVVVCRRLHGCIFVV